MTGRSAQCASSDMNAAATGNAIIDRSCGIGEGTMDEVFAAITGTALVILLSVTGSIGKALHFGMR